MPLCSFTIVVAGQTVWVEPDELLALQGIADRTGRNRDSVRLLITRDGVQAASHPRSCGTLAQQAVVGEERG